MLLAPTRSKFKWAAVDASHTLTAKRWRTPGSTINTRPVSKRGKITFLNLNRWIKINSNPIAVANQAPRKKVSIKAAAISNSPKAEVHLIFVNGQSLSQSSAKKPSNGPKYKLKALGYSNTETSR